VKSQKFHNWIFNSYAPTSEGLALYRIFAALLFLFFLIPNFSYYEYLGAFPDDFYTPPPGPMMLFDSFPSVLFLQTMHVLLIVSWIAVLLGFKTRWSSIFAGLSMLILQGFIFSIGKVNHEILLAVTPLLMAFSNWGASFSIDQKLGTTTYKTEGWPLVLLALFIGFMMFTAGLPKILGGWLDPATQATKGHLLNQHFVRGRQELLSSYAVNLDINFIWVLLDWATVIFEIGFLIAVFKAGWTRLFVSFAVLFHFSTMLILNIAFLPNFLAYAAFIKWDKVYVVVTEFFKNQSKEHTLNPVLLYTFSILFFFTGLKWLSDSEIFMSIAEPNFHELILISLALLFVIGVAAKTVMLTIREKKSVTASP